LAISARAGIKDKGAAALVECLKINNSIISLNVGDNLMV
jgi:hypothetical protein